jgi:hypothetical protein
MHSKEGEKIKNPNRKSLGRILNMIVHMRIHFIHGPWVEWTYQE